MATLFLALLAGAPSAVDASVRAAAASHVGHVSPRIADPLSRRYRTALREAAMREPDFATYYILAQIGCGAGCIRIAAIDARTGRVVWFPGTISGWPMTVSEPASYQLTDRVLVVQGMVDEREPVATRRYLFDGRRFVLLGDVPANGDGRAATD